MKKVIRVTFKNGDVFEIPAGVIAEHRANYYAKKDGYEKGSIEWHGEFAYSMTDAELYDWIGNNVDWSDVRDHAVKVEDENTPDYEMLWHNIVVDVTLKF